MQTQAKTVREVLVAARWVTRYRPHGGTRRGFMDGRPRFNAWWPINQIHARSSTKTRARARLFDALDERDILVSRGDVLRALDKAIAEGLVMTIAPTLRAT